MSATMMVDIEIRRARVKAFYPGPAWTRRVDKMSDEQILAIYLHKINEYPTEKKDEEPKCDSSQPPLPGL